MPSNERTTILRSSTAQIIANGEVLWCEKIHPGKAVPFSKARAQVRELLDQRAARNCQKAWIAQLRERAAAATGGGA